MTGLRPIPARVDGFLALGEYALLGDGRTCVLIASDGAVDWWPLPAMDSAPTFGGLLDPDHGGRLLLCPASREAEVTRTYVGDGGVLATRFHTATGTVEVTDALNLGLGSPLPWTELARRVESIDGEVPMRWEVVPGDRFGSAAPWERRSGDVPLITAGEQQLALVLDGIGTAEQIPGGFRGEFTARRGETGLLAVVAADGGPVPVPGSDAVSRRLTGTAEHWEQQRALVRYDGPWRDTVVRAALVHKQLTSADTGGLQAAATTSLPERIGGGRNFDYRYCWVRDTGFALDALTTLELRGEVQAALAYLLGAVSRTAPDVRALYALDGGNALSETMPVPLWHGYAGSWPVQVGNGAAKQRQLGAYGDLLEAVGRYAAHGNVLDGGSGRLVARVADQVCDQWELDDAGLWELGSMLPYTSSKIGCWAALDRAARLAEDGQVPDDRAAHWRRVGEAVHDYVDRECWSEEKCSYTFYAGTDELDCATLLAARTGFCSGDDPRLAGTIDAVRAELSAGGPLLYRYTGMQDQEGAFVACSFWMVEALAISGRVEEARELMDEMVGLATDLGLYGEQLDPAGRGPLGNFPQALSHLALISAATAYQRAAGETPQRA